LLGLLAGTILYRKPEALAPKKRKTRKFNPLYLAGVFAVLCLGALTIIMSRAEAFQRLFAAEQGEEGRFLVWGPIAEIAWKYLPFGSGIGSFVEVYQIDEPFNLLAPEYYNHAHNDWLEIYLTAGLPGIALIAVALYAYARTLWTAFRTPLGQGRGPLFARLGLLVIATLALGSIGDYPLRTPSLACIFVIAALWASGSRFDLENEKRQ
jgi:O-antigen ligase